MTYPQLIDEDDYNPELHQLPTAYNELVPDEITVVSIDDAGQCIARRVHIDFNTRLANGWAMGFVKQTVAPGEVAYVRTTAYSVPDEPRIISPTGLDLTMWYRKPRLWVMLRANP